MRQLFPSDAEATAPWTVREAVRRQRIIGPLWFMAQDRDGKLKRVIVEGEVEEITLQNDKKCGEGPGDYRRLDIRRLDGTTSSESSGKDTRRGEAREKQMPITPAIFWAAEGSDDVFLFNSRDSALRIGQLKVEGEKVKPAKVALSHFAYEAINKDQISS
jgi:hypothetical protein